MRLTTGIFTNHVFAMARRYLPVITFLTFYAYALPENTGAGFTAAFNQVGKSQTDVMADRAEYDMKSAWTQLTGNVAIRHAGMELHADSVRYNSETGDADAFGNVSLTTPDGGVWRGESLKVNMFSHQGLTGAFDLYSKPFRLMAESGRMNTQKEYYLNNAVFTTCTNDVGRFHYHVSAERLCLRPDDELIVKGAVPYMFGVPFFYWPYFWKDLERHYGFRFEPGYSGDWGPFLLSAYKTPLYRNKAEKKYLDSKTSVDYRMERGFAYGEKLNWSSGDDWKGWFSAYYLKDDDLPWDVEDEERYRLRFNHSWNVTPRDQILAQALYVSDDRFMEEFFEEEFDKMNQPENYVSYTHIGDSYSAGLIARIRLNDFYTQVERLPEGWFNLNSTELGSSGFYVENSTTIGFLNMEFDKRTFEEEQDPAYDIFRADSLTMINKPMKLMGFLSLVPRAGYRGTYFSKTLDKVEYDKVTSNGVEKAVEFVEGGSGFRNLFEAGMEISFKAFSTWQDFSGNTWRHVVEPYADYTYVPEPNLLPSDLYQFDDVDELGEMNSLRLGVRNRWQYKNNNDENASVNELLYIDFFGDINLDPEDGEDSLDTLNLDLRYRPARWMRFTVEGEYDAQKSQISDASTRLTVWHKIFSADAEYRYLVDDSSLVSGQLTWNINPEWAVSMYGRYEYETSRVEEVGTWLQRRFDCIAYRLYVSYEPGYTRSDGYEEESDLKLSLVCWLTAFQPDNIRELDNR